MRILTQPGLKELAARLVNGKIASLKLGKAQTTKMQALTNELAQRLQQVSDQAVKLQRIQRKLSALVKSWGIPKTTTQKCKGYKVIAKRLAYCVILTQ